MARLNLVIADENANYIDSLVSYISDNHNQKFQIFYFTDITDLKYFFTRNQKSIDIVLISSELYFDEIETEKVKTIIILSNSLNNKRFKDHVSIGKFQTGDSLVKNILNTYTDQNPDTFVNLSSSKNTRVVAVFSPIGGVGKTSMALSCSILSAKSGKSVFYLNLEDISSTPAFFKNSNENNFSHILFYIKSKSSNLGLKIEGIRSIDQESSVHYFLPAENAFELHDMVADEFTYLIEQLKCMNFYDIVYIDMSSSLDPKNIKILGSSDEIIFVVNQDPIAGIKAEKTLSQLNILEQKNELEFMSKFNPVLNRYNPGVTSQIESKGLFGKEISVKIPRVNPLLGIKEDKLFFNLNSPFGNAVEELVRRY